MAHGSMFFVRPSDLEKHKDEFDDDDDDDGVPDSPNLSWISREFQTASKVKPPPPMNVVIMIVGSRGDVQPFIAFAKGLQQAGHRVRLATHINFRNFVRDNGIDFYPLKGDPEHLMNFMVNHPDMITLNPDEISENQNMMEQIYYSAWKACTSDSFKPDVIISNPPVQVHVHIAQRLQIPLHIMFTMPWSPTSDYVHPLAPASSFVNNRQSYILVDRMQWLGLSGIINKFRKEIGLKPIMRGASLVRRLQTPMTYCMSSHLAPKPKDWGSHIDVVGFWFLDLKSDYTPPQDLVDFLAAGPPPLYVGFGSIVVDDPKALSVNVIEAIKASKLRAIVGAGWAKLGEGMDLPPTIKVVGAVPHDWLFPRCSAVCHHGGAGTTAAGLRAGLPTVIVPFFGDQPFWGSCVGRMGVGSMPIPYRELTKEKLTQAFLFCTKPDVVAAAKSLGEKLRTEDGVAAAVTAFHRKLPIHPDGTWSVEIWENQRYYVGAGWTDKTMTALDDRAKWTDKTGMLHLEKDAFPLPDGWEWAGDWEVSVGNDTDSQGWKYAFNFTRKGKWFPKEEPTLFARTRKWIRTRKFTGKAVDGEEKKAFTLFVEVIEARNLPKMDTFGLSDPFCEVRVKDKPEAKQQTQKTKIIYKCLTPVWKETMWFEVTENDTIELLCWDDDGVLGKEGMGVIEVPVKDAIQIKEKIWFPLTKAKKGEVCLAFSTF